MTARGLGAAAAAIWLGGVADAAVTASPGWAVRGIATPGVVQGGVVRRSAAIFVGQGTFGAGLQQVIRLDGEGGPATTIATGFNSLGGFDLDAGGTLYVADNGGNLPGAATGDTVFAIPDATTRTSALPAAGLEVVPAGTIPAAQDVLVVPGALLVSDAAGPGAGRVVRITGGTASPLITGLGYAAGLALDGSRLLVGDVDAFFVGRIDAYSLAGAPIESIAGGLGGNYAHVVGDGEVLVSGGFTGDFSSSTVLAVGPGGAVGERARGFTFSSEMFWHVARRELLVLDFGASEIAAICRDADQDGTCDVDQPPCTGAVEMRKAALKLAKLNTPAGDDTIALKGEFTLPVPVVPALDPAGKGARIRIGDAGGVVVDATIPAGAFDKPSKTGWKVNGAATAWKWQSPAGVGGIATLTVTTSPKAPGRVKVAVKGKGGSFETAPGALPLAATVALDAAGQCGTVTFAGAGGACAFNKKQSAVICK